MNWEVSRLDIILINFLIFSLMYFYYFLYCNFRFHWFIFLASLSISTTLLYYCFQQINKFYQSLWIQPCLLLYTELLFLSRNCFSGLTAYQWLTENCALIVKVIVVEILMEFNLFGTLAPLLLRDSLKMNAIDNLFY